MPWLESFVFFYNPPNLHGFPIPLKGWRGKRTPQCFVICCSSSAPSIGQSRALNEPPPKGRTPQGYPPLPSPLLTHHKAAYDTFGRGKECKEMVKRERENEERERDLDHFLAFLGSIEHHPWTMYEPIHPAFSHSPSSVASWEFWSEFWNAFCPSWESAFIFTSHSRVNFETHIHFRKFVKIAILVWKIAQKINYK